MNEFSDNDVANQFILGLIEQLNAPIEEIKQWLLITPLIGKEEEVHTLNHLIERAQRQVTVQIQILARFVQSQTQAQSSQLLSQMISQTTRQPQLPVVKLDESQLAILLGAIQSAKTITPNIPVAFTPIPDDDLPF